MAEIVSAISMSHAPGLSGWPEAAAPDVLARIKAALERIKRYLDDSKPDVLIAFLDDHFENHFRTLMPSLAVPVAPSHRGPTEEWRELLRFERTEELPGAEELSAHLLTHLVTQGFDAARMGSAQFGNNLMTPLQYIHPALETPLAPIFINVFSPPLMTFDRAYALGEAVRRSLAERDERVALLATGGLSHQPPFWMETSPEDDAMLQRMKRFQTEGFAVFEDDPNLFADCGQYEMRMGQEALQGGRRIINEEWDRKFLAAIGAGDSAYVRSLAYEDVEREGGNGAHEALLWAALMGAMQGAPANVLNYEAVNEFICGMAFAIYD